MKLIGSLASPYVRKVRVVLAEKKLDYELVLENVWSPDTVIHASNPLGKIPVLKTYRQMAIRQQKIKDWQQASWWVERGLTLYGEHAARPESVDDLRKRLTAYQAKVAAPTTPARSAASPPGPG